MSLSLRLKVVSLSVVMFIGTFFVMPLVHMYLFYNFSSAHRMPCTRYYISLHPYLVDLIHLLLYTSSAMFNANITTTTNQHIMIIKGRGRQFRCRVLSACSKLIIHSLQSEQISSSILLCQTNVKIRQCISFLSRARLCLILL